jgi:hypothetical protein
VVDIGHVRTAAGLGFGQAEIQIHAETGGQ